MKPIRLILLEDNPTDLKNLIQGFNESGVIDLKKSFMSGTDFLNYLPDMETEIDVLVIDYRMPNLNGLEVFRNLHAKNVPFKLLLVSHGYYSHVMKDLTSMGTQNYCRKTTDIILKAIHKVMDGKNVYNNQDEILYWEGLTKTSLLHLMDESKWQGELNRLERKIVKLISIGMGAKQIAGILGYETSSIEKYKGNIIHKLDLKNSQQLSAWAFANGLVTTSFLMNPDLNEL